MAFRAKLSLLLVPGALLAPQFAVAQRQAIPDSPETVAPPVKKPASKKSVQKPPTDKAGWIARLSTLDSENDDETLIYHFACIEPELLWSVLRDGWSKIKNEDTRSLILSAIESETAGDPDFEAKDTPVSPDRLNPHLLEILHLGAMDESESVRNNAFVQWQDIAAQTFADKAAYLAWHKTIEGKPAAQIIRESLKAQIERLKTAGDADDIAILTTLSQMTFVSRSKAVGSQTAAGAPAMKLTTVRRQAAVEANLVETIATLIDKPSPQPRAFACLAALARFAPDEAGLKRIADDVKRIGNVTVNRAGAFSGGAVRLLLMYRETWADDLYKKLVEAAYMTSNDTALIQALLDAHSPRTVPALIALLEVAPTEWTDAMQDEIAQQTGQPAEPKPTPAQWRDRLTKNPSGLSELVRNAPMPRIKTGKDYWAEILRSSNADQGVQNEVREKFGQISSDLQYDVLKEVWPVLQNDNVKRDLLNIIATGGNYGANADADKSGLRLLDVLEFGIKDGDPQTQQNALDLLGDMILQRFRDPESYVAWRKAAGTKSLTELVQEGAQTFAARFKTADTIDRAEMFDRLARGSFNNGVEKVRQNGQLILNVRADGLMGVRRSALVSTGLLDSVAELLHKSDAPELTQKAVDFLAAFMPDAAFMRRIEPDVQRNLTARAAGDETFQDNTLNLLFAYNAKWSTDLLMKLVKRDYLTPSGPNLLSVLGQSQDPRAIPLLVAVSGAMAPNEINNLNSGLTSLTKVPYDQKHDAAWWQDWWTKNKAKYPDAVRLIALAGIKTGRDALIERLIHNTQPYGMDWQAQQQFAQMDTEAQYLTLKDVWPRDVSDRVKMGLLQTLAGNYGGNAQKKDNPHLLDMLHLGMTDGSGEVQQQASQILFGLAMVSFSTQDAYFVWRKQSAGKPLADIVRAGAQSFLERFKQADEGSKAELLNQLASTPFYDGLTTETVNGKIVSKVTASGLTGLRRKVMLDGGLLDAIAPLLHSTSEDIAMQSTNFVVNFHPEQAYLDRIENDVRQAFTKHLDAKDSDTYAPLNAMMLYRGAWVGDLLAQYVQKQYLASNSSNMVRELMYANDMRVVPLLISLLDSVSKNTQSEMLRQMAQLTGTNYDAAHGSAWWRDWWTTNKEKLPEEARAMPFLALKKGNEVLVERLKASREGWDWELFQTFDGLSADERWNVLRDGWKGIKNEFMKTNLIERILSETTQNADGTRTEATNPHLLEMLSLFAADASDQVKTQALSFASGIAAKDLPDAKAYEAWRTSIGNRPLPDIVRQNTLELVTKLKTADAKEQKEILGRLSGLRWYSWLSSDAYNGVSESKIVASGLTAVRRQTALDAGLLDALAKLMKPGIAPEVSEKTLAFLMQFYPGRAFLKTIEEDVHREMTALIEKKKPVEYFSLYLLGTYSAKWATDALLKIAQAQYAANPDGVVGALCSSRDVRVMPTLIVLLDDVDEEGWEMQQIGQSLSRLSHTAYNQKHDAAWWREWWNKNKTALAADVRTEPFPDLHLATKYGGVFAIKKDKKQIVIGGDEHKQYALIASGLVVNRKRNAHALARHAANDFSDIPAENRPGLIVVLADNDTDASSQAGYWQEVVGKGFGGKYLVALAVAPQWQDKQSPLWLTRRERGTVKTAAFTTETLAAEIVRDAAARMPIDAAHVFLAGVGAGGQAAYACSLEGQTPFRGFVLLGSAFRSAVLPPLSGAKGRRYYVLHSPQDRKVPYFVGTAAQESLKHWGATVRFTSYPLDANAVQQAGAEQVIAGIKWLEQGTTPR